MKNFEYEKFLITIGKKILTEYSISIAYWEGIGNCNMKNEYTIKEVFDEKSKPLEEKLQEVFVSFLIEKLNQSN